MALLHQNEDRLREVLTCSNNRSYSTGPLSFAITWPRGLEMILDTRIGTYIQDLSCRPTIFTAFLGTALICNAKRPSTTMCTDCPCARSTNLLLQSLGDVYIPVWCYVSLAAVKTILSHIKYWREALAELARSELPLDVQAGFNLGEDSLLDFHASNVCKCLQSHGISPTRRLGLIFEDDRLGWNSR